MGLKREVRVGRVFVREKNLQGDGDNVQYINVTACLCSLITQYASHTEKANKCTGTGLTP